MQHYCDSTDHDGAHVPATATYVGRPVCAWHYEAMTYEPEDRGAYLRPDEYTHTGFECGAL